VSLSFYTDTHIAKQIAVQLRNKGVQIIRCEEVGLAEADDDEHLKYAVDHQLCIITKDDDFLRLHATYLSEGREHCGIFYSRQRDNPTIGEIVKACLEYYDLIESDAGDEEDLYNTIIFI